jgi:hypothetical protein
VFIVLLLHECTNTKFGWMEYIAIADKVKQLQNVN